MLALRFLVALDMGFERGGTLADGQHLASQPFRGAMRRLDRADRHALDVAQLLGDGRLDRAFERGAGGGGEVSGAFGDDRGDRFARSVGGVGGGLAHLKHRGDQRRAGLVAEAFGVSCGCGDRVAELAEARFGAADASVDRGKEPGEAIVLGFDRAGAAGEPLARFDRGVADFEDGGSISGDLIGQASGATFGFVQRAGESIADLRRKLLDRGAHGGGAVGELVDQNVVAGRLLAERSEFAAHPAERGKHGRGAVVAILREHLEALVERGEAAVEVGDEALRSALLFGDAAAQPVERAGRLAEVGAERLGGFEPGLGEPGGRLGNQRGDRRGLGVDPAADAVERLGGAAEQSLDLAAMRGGGVLELGARGGAGALDVGEVGDEPARGFADGGVGLFGALGQRLDVAGIDFGLARGLAASVAQPLGHRQRACFGDRQVGKEDADVGPCRARCMVERRAVMRQPLGARVEVARDRAQALRRLFAEPHQLARHAAQRLVTFGDPRAEDGKQSLERMRLVAHRDDRVGKALGFLAAGAAEHQPAEPEQGERAGDDRDPLRERRRTERHCGERMSGGPGAVGDPQRGEQSQRPAEHHPPASAVMLGASLFPLSDVEPRFLGRRVGISVERHLLARAFGRSGAERFRFHAPCLPRSGPVQSAQKRGRRGTGIRRRASPKTEATPDGNPQ